MKENWIGEQHHSYMAMASRLRVRGRGGVRAYSVRGSTDCTSRSLCHRLAAKQAEGSSSRSHPPNEWVASLHSVCDAFSKLWNCSKVSPVAFGAEAPDGTVLCPRLHVRCAHGRTCFGWSAEHRCGLRTPANMSLSWTKFSQNVYPCALTKIICIWMEHYVPSAKLPDNSRQNCLQWICWLQFNCCFIISFAGIFFFLIF